MSIVTIPLDKGMFSLIDLKDLELVSRYKWYAREGSNGIYYATSTLHKKIHMHRLILGLTDTKVIIDHINHNGLDNTRKNLRPANQAQNSHNQRPHNDSTSKYKGVYWNNEKLRWTAQIKIGSKSTHIGHYRLEIDAAEAYNKKAKEVFGEYAYLNKTTEPVYLT